MPRGIFRIEPVAPVPPGAGALPVPRPCGLVVQVGLVGDMTLPTNRVVAPMGSRRIDLRPLPTATVPYGDAPAAFALAQDRTRSMAEQPAF